MINAILTHIVLPEVLIIQMLCIHKKKKELIIYRFILEAFQNICERECTRTGVCIFSDTVKR